MENNHLTKWQLSCLVALVIAFLAAGPTKAQANLPNEIPNKKEELQQDIKDAVKVQPEDPKLDPKNLAPTATNSDGQTLPNSAGTNYQPSQPGKIGFHGAVGVPHPLSFGFDYLGPEKIFGLSLNVGAYATKASDVDISIVNQEFGLEYHPWAGSFFLGLLVGQQSIKGKKDVIISGNTLTAEVDIKCTYFTPHIGWHAIWDSGFTLGFEMGYQSPSRNSTDMTTNVAAVPGVTTATPEYQQLVQDVQDQGDKIGKIGLPYVTLLRLGWMF